MVKADWFEYMGIAEGNGHIWYVFQNRWDHEDIRIVSKQDLWRFKNPINHRAHLSPCYGDPLWIRSKLYGPGFDLYPISGKMANLMREKDRRMWGGFGE